MYTKEDFFREHPEALQFQTLFRLKTREHDEELERVETACPLP